MKFITESNSKADPTEISNILDEAACKMMLISFDHNIKTCNEEQFPRKTTFFLSHFKRTVNSGPCLSVIVFLFMFNIGFVWFCFFSGVQGQWKPLF